MDTLQNLGTPNHSRFGVFKLSKPKRLKARHGLPDSILEGSFVYRALSELDTDSAWGTWLGEQRNAAGICRTVLLKHTGEGNRTRAGADALWLEALLTLKLDGPHVVPLVDYGVLDGRPFAVYEFEEGVFLAQVLEGLRERGRRLPSAVSVGIVLQACEVMKRLHALTLEGDAGGFVHGSLCPRNLLLTERGDVKIMGLVGARPVGRVVGREHVPAAAMAYASPDLLGGAPVTPTVDVYSLGAILRELLGEAPASEPERDDLGAIVRDLLRAQPTGGFASIDALANALQDAVRRTGTVVARQSIGAQVRMVCEQYLLERRRQVRSLRELDWRDQRETPTSESLTDSASEEEDGAIGAGEFEASEVESDESDAASGQLGAYSEETDDAVTRIYEGEEPEAEGHVQPQAWMHDSGPPEAGRAAWSRWAVVTLLGVLVAVASSGAAVMASRSMAHSSAPGSEAKLAAASGMEASSPKPETAKADVAKTDVAKPVVPTAEPARPSVTTSTVAAPAERVAALDPEPEPEPAERSASGAKGHGERARPTLRRLAAQPHRATRGTPDSVERRSRANAEPATVDVSELPEAREESEPAAAPAPKTRTSSAAPLAAAPRKGGAGGGGDGDLVIEEAPKVAFLSVDATPYATVFIDGDKKGVTPIVRMELEPGLHRMIARAEDGKTKRYTLQLEAGKTETVKVVWGEGE
jgi:serine/threonine protein kinase